MTRGTRSSAVRRTVSLPEIVLLLTILVVVGAALWSVLWAGDLKDQRLVVDHNLQTLTRSIDEFRLDHEGRYPPSLGALLVATNSACELGGAQPNADFPFGPYLDSLPENPLAESDKNWSSEDSEGGWRYNPRTGRVSIEAVDKLTSDETADTR